MWRAVTSSSGGSSVYGADIVRVEYERLKSDFAAAA
jgi:hypothetical protein